MRRVIKRITLAPGGLVGLVFPTAAAEEVGQSARG